MNPMAADFEEAERLIHTTISHGKQLEQMARSRPALLAVMRRWLELLDLWEPLQRMPAIHIAGTKGKGSTSAFCESMLRAAGFRTGAFGTWEGMAPAPHHLDSLVIGRVVFLCRTGLFTSPHLVDIRERFRLDGVPVSKEVFVRYFSPMWTKLVELAATSGDGENGGNVEVLAHECLRGTSSFPFPGFFHLLTLLAFAIFLGEGVDVIVVEVGLGGRLDATNVVPSPIASAVTTIDYDHMHILGSTLPEIAREKAGIFKKGVPVFTVPQAEGVLATLHDRAQSSETHVKVVWPDSLPPGSVQLGLAGEFQRTNAALAVALCDVFFCGHTTISEEASRAAVRQGLMQARWPGRAQAVERPLPSGQRILLFLDGAHTGRSMVECAHWFSTASASAAEPPQTGRRRIRRLLWFNCSHEKEAVPLILPLARCRQPWDGLIVSPFDFTRPSRVRRKTAEEAIQECLDAPRRLLGAVYEGPKHLAGDESGDGDVPRACESPSVEGDEESLSWQQTLVGVWRACFLDPRLRRLRLAEFERPGRDDPSTQVRCGELDEGEEVPPARVEESIAAAWERIQADARQCSSETDVHVLVTGSLYLIGGVLKAIGWTEERLGE